VYIFLQKRLAQKSARGIERRGHLHRVRSEMQKNDEFLRPWPEQKHGVKSFCQGTISKKYCFEHWKMASLFYLNRHLKCETHKHDEFKCQRWIKTLLCLFIFFERLYDGKVIEPF